MMYNDEYRRRNWIIEYYSCRKYTLQENHKLYNDGDIIDYIEWYDNDYDITRAESNIKIEQIGENMLQISNCKCGDLADIWICDITEIR